MFKLTRYASLSPFVYAIPGYYQSELFYYCTFHFTRFIDLSNRELDDIPDVLFDFVEAEELHLEENALHHIPDEIESMRNLK